MRIGFVTQWFPPEPRTVVPEGIADGLAALGHHVDVVTGFPNYPTGEIMPGWSQRPYLRQEGPDRITVHRSPLYPSRDAQALRRMANYLSFAVTATVTASTRLPRPDVWLVYSSPATANLPAMLARPGRRAPICLYIQDLWPDSVIDSEFVTGRVARSIERSLHGFTNASYRLAKGIGVISPTMKDVLVNRGVPAEKIHWVPNWVPDFPSKASHADRPRLGLPEGPLFLYAGNLGQLQGLRSLIDAFARVPQASLVLMGDGVERDSLVQAASAVATQNVHVLSAVPVDAVGDYLAAADVLVVSLQDTPLLRATMPSKVQSSMSAGKPVFVHGAGDVADVVAKAGAGVAAPPGDLRSVAEAISTLAQQPQTWSAMGQSARQYYEEHFAPAVGIKRLESMVLEAATKGQQ